MNFRTTADRDEAAAIAELALERGFAHSQSRPIELAEWRREYWDYEKSSYILQKNAWGQKKIGREYAYNMQKCFQKNVEPYLPKGLLLSETAVIHLDSALLSLLSAGSSISTAEAAVRSFALPLKKAVRLGHITSSPAEKLLPFHAQGKIRGTLTEDEAKRLVEELEKRRGGMNKSLRTMILLALFTGMRMSEIRVLSSEDIRPSSTMDFHIVSIRRSLGYLMGEKETKGRRERSAYIPSFLALEILENAGQKAAFPSGMKGKEHISPPTLRSAFYEILRTIGITEEERKRRRIVFHIPIPRFLATTGHRKKRECLFWGIGRYLSATSTAMRQKERS